MSGSQRYEVIEWLGEASLYDSEAQRDEIADKIIASGLSTEQAWIAIMEKETGA